MKQLSYKLILPLSLLSIIIFNKWWFAIPIDAPDTVLWGFPFIFMAEAWHTSGALQFFILPFFANLCLIFLSWLLLFTGINHFYKKIALPKFLLFSLWTLTSIFLLGSALLIFNSNNLFYINRPFQIKILDSGYHLIWQKTSRPKIEDYKNVPSL